MPPPRCILVLFVNLFLCFFVSVPSVDDQMHFSFSFHVVQSKKKGEEEEEEGEEEQEEQEEEQQQQQLFRTAQPPTNALRDFLLRSGTPSL